MYPSDMLYVVPSRGRPENIDRLLQAFKATTSRCQVIVVVDTDDPKLSEYELVNRKYRRSTLIVSPPNRLVPALNLGVSTFGPEHDFIGFMGDDHLPLTADWDLQFAMELNILGTGIVYGNDLLQGEEMPTAVCMTSDIIESLGYMAPPSLEHLCVDLVWKEWGKGLGKLKYRDDIIIEHLHPANEKAELDESYVKNNSPDQVDKDAAAYYAYIDTQLDLDLEKIRKHCGLS